MRAEQLSTAKVNPTFIMSELCVSLLNRADPFWSIL
jgi:hypothetical protein